MFILLSAGWKAQEKKHSCVGKFPNSVTLLIAVSVVSSVPDHFPDHTPESDPVAYGAQDLAPCHSTGRTAQVCCQELPGAR